MDSDRTQIPDGAVNSQPPAATSGNFGVPANTPVGQPVTTRPSQTQQPTPRPPQPSIQNSSAPDEAEMDKAWVDHAVTILDKTRDDPFMQSQEIAKLKAQYMQARFDKQIKLMQEQ